MIIIIIGIVIAFVDCYNFADGFKVFLWPSFLSGICSVDLGIIQIINFISCHFQCPFCLLLSLLLLFCYYYYRNCCCCCCCDASIRKFLELSEVGACGCRRVKGGRSKLIALQIHFYYYRWSLLVLVSIFANLFLFLPLFSPLSLYHPSLAYFLVLL